MRPLKKAISHSEGTPLPIPPQRRGNLVTWQIKNGEEKKRKKKHEKQGRVGYEKKVLVFLKNPLVFFKNVLVFFCKVKWGRNYSAVIHQGILHFILPQMPQMSQIFLLLSLV